MATVTATRTTNKTEKKTERFVTLERMAAGTVILVIKIKSQGPRIGERVDTFRYLLRSVASDFGIGYQLDKLGPIGEEGEKPETYHVHFEHDGASCDCKGCTRHGHCKHVESLKALGEAGRLVKIPTL